MDGKLTESGMFQHSMGLSTAQKVILTILSSRKNNDDQQ
jgi:hypothetical protein